MSIEIPDFKKDFGDWLRRNRKFAGLSLDALGSKVGVTKAAISAWETGKAAPTLPNAILLAWALDAPLPIPDKPDVTDLGQGWVDELMDERAS